MNNTKFQYEFKKIDFVIVVSLYVPVIIELIGVSS